MSIQITVDTLYRGGVGERIKAALDDVVKNIMDPDTIAKKTRTVTIKLKVTPNEARNMAEMKVETSTTLCPPQAIETTLALTSNLKTGEMFIEEIMPSENMNQYSFEGTNNLGKVARDSKSVSANDDETVYKPAFQ